MLAVNSVSVTIDGVGILDDVSLQVSPGEVVVVLGPSGSGKSTLLRAIAGLTDPAGGIVAWGGQSLETVPPHERGFGLMFQDLALFPHRDVAGNVAFGLEMRHAPDTAEAVAEALALVSLSELGERAVDTLSGGEQQRVALARSLAPHPRLLMLDEPLGSLDRTLREQLTRELRSIFDGLDTAVLYVTHDQDEALVIADRIVILHQGRVVQQGTPQEVWRHPATEFVARFIGWSTFADAEATNGAVATPWGQVATAAADGAVRVALPPGAAALDDNGELAGVVTSNSFTGVGFAVHIRSTTGPAVEVSSSTPITVGTKVHWTVDPSALSIFG